MVHERKSCITYKQLKRLSALTMELNDEGDQTEQATTGPWGRVRSGVSTATESLSRRDVLLGTVASAGGLMLASAGGTVAAEENGEVLLRNNYSTNPDGHPLSLYLDEESTLDLVWDGMSQGDTLALVVELSGENGQAEDITADSGDLEFVDNNDGDGSNLRPGEGSTGGVYFDVDGEEGAQSISLKEMCGEARMKTFNGDGRGLDLGEHHNSISPSHLEINPEDVDTEDDLWTAYSVSASVVFAHVGRNEVIASTNETFEFVYFLDTGFGHYPGLLFGQAYPDEDEISHSIGGDMPPRLEEAYQ